FCRALAPLGIELIAEVEGWAGLGNGGKPELPTTVIRSEHSMQPPSLPGEPTTVLREFGPYITQTISAPLSSARTATMWKQSVTGLTPRSAQRGSAPSDSRHRGPPSQRDAG